MRPQVPRNQSSPLQERILTRAPAAKSDRSLFQARLAADRRLALDEELPKRLTGMAAFTRRSFEFRRGRAPQPEHACENLAGEYRARASSTSRSSSAHAFPGSRIGQSILYRSNSRSRTP